MCADCSDPVSKKLIQMILHVATEQEWTSCLDEDYYAPATLVAEGFIHACKAEQLKGVLERYFAGRKDLILLHIDEFKLLSPVVLERGTGRELFPHVYGKINKDAIVKSEALIS